MRRPNSGPGEADSTPGEAGSTPQNATMGDVPTLRGAEPTMMSSGMPPGDALALRAANSEIKRRDQDAGNDAACG